MLPWLPIVTAAQKATPARAGVLTLAILLGGQTVDGETTDTSPEDLPGEVEPTPEQAA